MVRKFASVREASEAAVSIIIAVARRAAADRGFFSLVLAGGTTPGLTYRLLAEPAHARQIPWQQCYFFWGDERWLPLSHPDSNFALVHETLLDKVKVPTRNIFPIPTGEGTPGEAAALYEKRLRFFFRKRLPAATKRGNARGNFPTFDLALLGMGPDGHTASLFPGSPLLEEQNKWVVDVPEATGSPPVARITLTLPVFNRAANVLFLVAGSDKLKILETIRASPQEAAERYPAARVRPAGNLVWLAAEKG
jgi:6-phosphogluconolactonase